MFNQKKILVLITGKLRFLDQKNILRLKNSFENFKLDFFVLAWKGQKQSIIDEFKKHYKPIFYHEIDEYNFNHIVEKIKYPDGAVKTENILHVWKGISEAVKYLKNFYPSKNKKPFYILRYRSDILPKLNSEFLKKKLNNREILIPDRYHWNGLNDQIFLLRYDDFILFDEIDEFIKKHIRNNRFFCSEYIFQQFLRKQKFKIKFSQFDYNLMKFKNQNKPFSDIKTKKPIVDWFNCKINKLKYKLRNFNEHYIKKKYRNKNQDIEI